MKIKSADVGLTLILAAMGTATLGAIYLITYIITQLFLLAIIGILTIVSPVILIQVVIASWIFWKLYNMTKGN